MGLSDLLRQAADRIDKGSLWLKIVSIALVALPLIALAVIFAVVMFRSL